MSLTSFKNASIKVAVNTVPGCLSRRPLVKIKRRLWIAISSCLTFALVSVNAQNLQVKKLAAAEAKDHIGQQSTVCGKVASTRYAAMSRGKPTFLNLDKPYPSQVFTILIWGGNREKFGTPEEKYRDKQVCVTGKITEYRGAPEIVVTEPQSIEIEK
jgi:hypothetical protein